MMRRLAALVTGLALCAAVHCAARRDPAALLNNTAIVAFAGAVAWWPERTKPKP